MRFILSAGEASGDAYAAELIRELLALGVEADSIAALGGARVHQLPIRSLGDCSRWGSISITEAFNALPKIFTTYFAVKKQLGPQSPGIFVPIDFGYVNIKLARHAKKNGWKVVYWLPPGSWRKDRQGKDLGTIADAVITQFPWSKEILAQNGVNTEYFGHPLLQLMQGVESFNLTSDYVAVLPGSREHELKELIPIYAKAFSNFPDLKPVVALAPNANQMQAEMLWKRHDANSKVLFVVGKTREVLKGAKAGLICSGTATLEAAILGCPHVIVYRVSPFVRLEIKLIGFKLPKFIGLPNILAEKPIVKELIQDDCTPEQIRRELLRAIEERDVQTKAFSELTSQLEPADAITAAARFLLDFSSKAD